MLRSDWPANHLADVQGGIFVGHRDPARDGAAKPGRHLSEHESVSIGERRGLDLTAVHVRPESAAEVGHNAAGGIDDDLRMAPRHTRVGECEVASGASANHRGAGREIPLSGASPSLNSSTYLTVPDDAMSAAMVDGPLERLQRA